jgi:2-oxoisovalerate dehydrogenase E1 component
MTTTLSESPLDALIVEAVRIRVFETRLLDLFKAGLISGTVHTCIGQEFCAAALHPHLRPGVDAFFATHRGHGHFLSYGGSEGALLAELMGRDGALCLGRGGTQNLNDGRFFSSGIQGGSAPVATGFAWALRRRGEDAIAVAQIGDGTLGEGAVYEAFTFAALLRAPVLFLLEANGWAQSTDARTTTPGDILRRAEGFGLEAAWASDEDPATLHELLGRAVARVRRGAPFLQVIETRRLMAHSKGDDNRAPELVEALWERDPIRRLGEARRAASARRAAELAMDATIKDVAARPPLRFGADLALPPGRGVVTDGRIRSEGRADRAYGRVAEELNRGLHEVMAADRYVVLIGEDLLDPYGGAFKVSRGLSTRFPDQVFSTPIAEGAIVGVSNGMALAGMRPVAEIMFADFATLAADQLINFAAKFHAMYGGKVVCPITVRLVSGGGRGYGPTHSQCLESLFCGVPGLRVLALSRRHDPAALLDLAVRHDDSPKVFVENKQLYPLRTADTAPADLRLLPSRRENGGYPPLCYAPQGDVVADVTVVTYGGSAEVAERAMRQLIETEELRFEYIILTQLWPLEIDEVLDSVRRTGRLVVVEENHPAYSVGAAVIAEVAQRHAGRLACRTVGARAVPLPSARHLEDEVLPSAEVVAFAVSETL